MTRRELRVSEHQKPVGFLMRKEEVCACPKFSQISGRHADLWYFFFRQCAHCWKKTVPGVHAAGNDGSPE
jgi:hypothetical protein